MENLWQYYAKKKKKKRILSTEEVLHILSKSTEKIEFSEYLHT